MDKRINVNGTEYIVKMFIPNHTGYQGNPKVLADKMCDDFSNEHPELEECSREIVSEFVERIVAGFPVKRSITYALCLYKVK